jgi:hypothetical protein
MSLPIRNASCAKEKITRLYECLEYKDVVSEEEFPAADMKKCWDSMTGRVEDS